MNIYSVIMAGGGGTRFWPLSRHENPKQLLNLGGRDTLINETIDRITEAVDKDYIFIVTNEGQAKVLENTVNNKVLKENILLEPVMRNTAACIGYAAFSIFMKYGDGVMCVFPSDHHIKDEKEFSNIVKKAVSIAEYNDKLITIGIKPTFPSTGYGYIKSVSGREVEIENCFKVDEFVEKPNFKTATRYVKDGNYYWNSGMFVWKVSVILENFKRFLPKLYNGLKELSKYMGTENEYEKVKEIYPSLLSTSIDYGVMERSNNVLVIPGDFGWNDVGSWDSLGALYESDDHGNIIKGENIGIDTKNSIVYSDKRMIATIGVSNLIIVETDDAVLVCPKDRAQDVKKVVEILKQQGKVEYL